MDTKRLTQLAAVVITALVCATASAKPVTKVIWHGHAAFEIVTPSGLTLMIDPWLNNPQNPQAAGGKNAVNTVGKLDYILITHAHFDHVGDAVALAKKTKARLVTNFELGTNLASRFGYPAGQMGFDTLMNIGGEIEIGDGEVRVAMVPAVHSSGLKVGNEAVYGGNPAGFVLKIKDGPTIYHTGDTAYFDDMALIGKHYAPDLALINIGGHFGMEPPMAALAAKAVGAKWVVPHHFKTFPILTPDTKEFFKALGRQGKEIAPGDVLEFTGNRLN